MNWILFGLFFLLPSAPPFDMTPVSSWTNGPCLKQALANPPLVQPQVVKHPKLVWDWVPGGPVFFEVWHTNQLPATLTIVGTNVPAGFTMLTNVLSPSTDISTDLAKDFFIVRAGNSLGYTEWNR